MSLNVAYAAAVKNNGFLKEGEDKQRLSQCIYELLKLNDHKMELLLFLEGTIKTVAPNVCEIIGTKITAKLVSSAGGITELSRIPACNIQVLG